MLLRRDSGLSRIEEHIENTLNPILQILFRKRSPIWKEENLRWHRHWTPATIDGGDRHDRFHAGPMAKTRRPAMPCVDEAGVAAMRVGEVAPEAVRSRGTRTTWTWFGIRQ